jgi:DNA-binding LacI/PurR family transcriptional regulator
LRARGVRGLLVGQTTLGRRPWVLPWEDFAVVHCGLYVPPSAGDVVAPDLLGAVDMGWRALLARGHRRIAAVLPIDQRALPEQVLAGSLLALERAVGNRRQLAAWVGPRAEVAAAVAWLRGRRCDAVLGYDEALWLRLRRAGIAAPYAAMAVSAGDSPVAGPRLPFAAIGSAAVDMLEAKLRHGERGDGGARRIHLLPTPWGGGASLPDG